MGQPRLSLEDGIVAASGHCTKDYAIFLGRDAGAEVASNRDAYVGFQSVCERLRGKLHGDEFTNRANVGVVKNCPTDFQPLLLAAAAIYHQASAPPLGYSGQRGHARREPTAGATFDKDKLLLATGNQLTQPRRTIN